jgi:hypothetical protein
VRWPRGHSGVMVGEHRRWRLSSAWAREQGTLTQTAAGPQLGYARKRKKAGRAGPVRVLPRF